MQALGRHSVRAMPWRSLFCLAKITSPECQIRAAQYLVSFVLQMENDAKGENITLANGSLSGLMVYPKVTLNRGWGKMLYFCQSRCQC